MIIPKLNIEFSKYKVIIRVMIVMILILSTTLPSFALLSLKPHFIPFPFLFLWGRHPLVFQHIVYKHGASQGPGNLDLTGVFWCPTGHKIQIKLLWPHCPLHTPSPLKAIVWYGILSSLYLFSSLCVAAVKAIRYIHYLGPRVGSRIGCVWCLQIMLAYKWILNYFFCFCLVYN